MSTEKIKAPFDLEKALAGAPVVTRNGRKVLEIRKFDSPGITYPLFAYIEGEGDGPDSYTVEGKLVADTEEEFDDDLFMEIEPVVRWVNFYPDSTAFYYETQAIADICADAERLEGKAYKVVVNG